MHMQNFIARALENSGQHQGRNTLTMQKRHRHETVAQNQTIFPAKPMIGSRKSVTNYRFANSSIISSQVIPLSAMRTIR